MKTSIGSLLAGVLFTVCTVKAQQGPPPGDRPGPPPSRQERLKQVTTRLEKDLALKADQKQKVQNAYKSFFEGMEKLRGGKQGPPPPPPVPPIKKAEMDKLVKARDESIKKTLNADQFKKYKEIEKTMGPRGGRGPGGPPPEGRDGPPPGQDERTPSK